MKTEMKTTILKCVFVVFVLGSLSVNASFLDCCESFKDELERKSRASEVLCSQNDTYVPLQSFGDDCCNSSKAELKEKWDAYKILCSTTPTKNKECPKSMIFKKTVNDYAISKGAPVMKVVTACFWVNTQQTGGTGQYGNPHFISYAAGKIPNHFIVFGATELGLYFSTTGPTSSQNIKVNDGRWHHICVTWQSKDGQYLFYKDGKKVGGGSFPNTVGKSLQAGGTWVLGQDQDTVGGGFEVRQAFKGEMTGVNIWNRVLTKDEILKLSTNCNGRATGNVKSWAEFMSGISGNVGIGKPTCCY